MISKISRNLKDIFYFHRILDMNGLIQFSKRFRANVFRDLRNLNYLSSYTHTGSYYTIMDIAYFDKYRLWYHNENGFFRNGNFKSTLSFLIDNSEDGKTHAELEGLLRIRVQNTLLDLVKEGLILHKKWGKSYLYLSPDSERSNKQLTYRY